MCLAPPTPHPDHRKLEMATCDQNFLHLAGDIIADFVTWMVELRNQFESSDLPTRLSYINMCHEMLQCCVMLEMDMEPANSALMGEAIIILQELIDHLENNTFQYRFPGRPRLEISEEVFRFLISNDLSLADMGIILGCSPRTVQRRMGEQRYSRRQRYSNMSDSEIDTVVSDIQSSNPRTGCRMVDGVFRSNGCIIQRIRIRESMRRVNPNGARTRLARALHRRTYNVTSPNSLWHMDGNHKLVRWRLIIHGCIDGFSRLVVYLNIADNNRASTVLSMFLQGVSEFGLPSRMRSDMGGENTLVAQYMINHPERGPGCMITGRSVHNQRIERLWRDVFADCTSYFYALFHAFEESGILDHDNEVDLLALHIVYVDEIQDQLDKFKNGWNHHRMRTCHNRTPMQQWVLGLHARSDEDPTSSAITGLDNRFTTEVVYYSTKKI